MRLLGLFLISFLFHSPTHALVSQFQVEQELENGERAVTEVMVSEVDFEDLDWKLSEFKSFLGAQNHPVKFIYAAASDALLEKKGWSQIISEDDITSRMGDVEFAESTKVELPEEWFAKEGRTPQSDPVISLHTEFDRYYNKKFKSRRITLIASRTIFNGVIASLGFIAGGIPAGPAMVVGSLTGIMSGGIQALSSHFLDFLSTNKYEIKLRKLLGLKPVELKASKFLATQMKWLTTEFAFLAILDVARFSLGVLPPTTMANEAFGIGLTSLKSLGSQGLVDTALAKDIGPKLKAAIEAGDFARAAKLRFRNEIVSFSSSMVWAGAAITDMMGLPIGNILFGSMATVGGGHHLKLVLKDKANNIGKFFVSACNWFMTRIRPSKAI